MDGRNFLELINRARVDICFVLFQSKGDMLRRVGFPVTRLK